MRQPDAPAPPCAALASGKTAPQPGGIMPVAVPAPGGRRRPVLVAGIGASAGGLTPLRTLLAGLEQGQGLALVIVFHLPAPADSDVASTLAGETSLAVVEAVDGAAIEADHVYVTPPGKSLSLTGGRLTVLDVAQCQSLVLPVDHFFCTLAVDQGHRAVGLILSGSGTDGTHGLAEIKTLGGATVAQTPASADFPEMPASAIAAGHADAVLPPAGLSAYLRQRASELLALTTRQEEEAGLAAVLAAIQAFTGHDFHCYKRATLERRIRRRMALHGLATFDDYARLLRTHRGEPAAMRQDLLIGVTAFFRQAEAWLFLQDKVVVEVVAAAPPHSTLRAWVPACANGKEAYSLGILFAEAIEKSGKALGLQLFATDADEAAVRGARAGQYAEEEMKGVTPARLARYFERQEGGYQVAKPLSEVMVFAQQDLTCDPPFSRLDLVSCRNLLIYLDQPAQRRIIQLFHFALREGGYLFLGAAETVSGHEHLFDPVSTRWRIYRKKGLATPIGLDLPRRAAGRLLPALPAQSRPRPRLAEMAHQGIAERFGPPSVVVDRHGAPLFLHGDLGDFLHLPPGVQTGLLVDAAREGLQHRLASALGQAVSENARIAVQARVKKGGRLLPVRVTVSPLRQSPEAEGLFLVTFERQRVTRAARGTAVEAAPSRLSQVEDELLLTREELSGTIERLEQSNEHLRAANEEAMSANEELQAANEELHTSQEELHSLNEELQAVNQRLQEKVAELERAGNDIANLLVSGGVATLFLDQDLRVRRFTPAVTRLFSLIDSDIGRPITEVVRRFQDPIFLDDARRVLKGLAPAAAEVQAEDGTWHSRRILPYRTQSGRVEGVVVTFADVTGLKELTDALRVSEARAHWVGRFPAENPNPVIRVSASGVVLYQNPAARAQPAWRGEVGQLLPQEELRRLARQALAEGSTIEEDMELGDILFAVAVAPVPAEGYANMYGRNVTDRRRAEDLARQRLAEIEDLYRSAPVGLGVLDRELRFVRINERLAEMHGIPAPAHIGKRMRDLLPELAEVAGPMLRRILTTGQPQEDIEIVSETPAQPGVKRSFLEQWLPITDAQGQVTGLSMVVEETTARKAAEEALRRSREDLDRAQAVGQIGSWRLDTRENTLAWSDETYRIFGVPPGTPLTYEAFLKAVHPDDREQVAAQWEAALGGAPYDLEHRIVVDGRVKWVREKAYLERDAGGRLLGGFGIAQDITELKEGDEALRRAVDELRRSNEDLQQFAYVASHDLQEPLRMVKGFLKLLDDRYKPQLDDKARQFITYAVEGATRMSQLISDLLEFSRVASRADRLRPTDAEQVLAKALANLGSRIRKSGSVVTHDALPVVLGDATQLMQLFQNLISNAIKFRQNNGPCVVHVGVAKDGSQWRFSVRDNGIGIAEAALERVFVIFQRLHTREQYSGTGIGLAICKKIVERHGGRIWVESRVGEGSIFFFTLPEAS
ncbi:MAG: CheR family methyltransferase [Thermodesulfobacteriota bacterium]